MTDRRADIVVDPSLPDDVAQSFRENPVLLSRIRAGWRPDAPSPADRRIRMMLGTLAAAAAIVVGAFLFVHDRDAIGLLLIGGAVIWASTGLLVRDEPAEDRALYDNARWYAAHYLLPEDFDRAAHELMARTQRAVRSVLESAVHAEGLLDDVRNNVTLPAQEWEIARLLAKLSSLREEHREFVGGGLTPEAAAVAEPLERALAGSEAAVVARVEALERYAGHVAEAERAYHARHQIEELRTRLPKYEELLAESGADSLAMRELDRLADDADRLEQALRHSVASAREAFRHLEQ
ncbi:hypothetical protein HNP84_008778 [Thermocatellispora tengchongensis]|uniref:Uncharacterized protein n=1 Tax=Thermocatellispora tengchongensis TaxID=1073253 RepID=A0A840PJE6_9ACTN|nr:hypothetical protein [Thermocatellispora tengchongensis]MBB5139016.1 hypothetical protein [Thermocatellispora tengchongensis]